MTTVRMLDNSQKKAIHNAFLQGATKSELADAFSVSARTIGRVIAEYTETKKAPVRAEKPKATEKPAMIGSESFVSVIKDGQIFTADSSHPMFETALEALKKGDVNGVMAAINTRDALKIYSRGNIRIVGNQLLYKNVVFDVGITQRIIQSMHDGKPFEHLLEFFERLMHNPSRDAVYQLFGFLVHNDIEITEDGHFLAWKRVRDNYRDFASGKFDNSLGTTVQMPRNMVDEDKNRTCSHGLHVAAKSYLPHYGGGQGVIIQCKVDPADVVAIPTDYENAKMRVCRYKVMKDVTAGFSHYR